MIAAALHAVVAQRLLRRVCTDCAEPARPDEHEAAWLLAKLGAAELQAARFVVGKGCSFCNGSGYRGRIAVHELLQFDRNLAEAVRRADHQAVEVAARHQPGFRPITRRALELAAQSVTTVAEVMTQLSGLEEAAAAPNAGSAEELAPGQVEQLLAS
jgi:MSHA biogenesis protein MshE